jgi:hypothetical protein
MTTSRTRIRAAWLAGAPLVVADWVCLAAAPTFAMLALLAAAPGSSHEMMGSTAHGASPLSGMVLMYVLMSAFHTAPWLKLVSRRSRSCKHTKRPGLDVYLGDIARRRFQATRTRPRCVHFGDGSDIRARCTAVAAMNGIQSKDTSDRLIRRLR